MTTIKLHEITLERILGEGTFSIVYEGLNERDERCAVKVARPQAEPLSGATGTFTTRALTRGTNVICETLPDTSELLRIQFEQLNSVVSPHLPVVGKFDSTAGGPYMTMEFIEGPTLRQLMSSGEAGISHLLELVQALQQLSARPGWQYHGDLKPENVLFSPGGVRFLDPGYFGLLRCESALKYCMVTTPQYYPFLSPDDVLAAGLIAWEVITGEPVITNPRETNTDAKRKPAWSAELESMISSEEMVGNSYASLFRSVQLHRSHDSELFKLIGLQISSGGRIDKSAPVGYLDLYGSLQRLQFSQIVERSKRRVV